MTDPDLLTTGQAAEMLAVSPDTIRRWVATGKVAALTLPSGQLRLRRADVQSLLVPTIRCEAS